MSKNKKELTKGELDSVSKTMHDSLGPNYLMILQVHVDDIKNKKHGRYGKKKYGAELGKTIAGSYKGGGTNFVGSTDKKEIPDDVTILNHDIKKAIKETTDEEQIKEKVGSLGGSISIKAQNLIRKRYMNKDSDNYIPGLRLLDPELDKGAIIVPTTNFEGPGNAIYDPQTGKPFPTTSPIDEISKTHDIAYDAAVANYKLTRNKDDLFSEIKAADRTMIDSLESLPQSVKDKYPYQYRLGLTGIGIKRFLESYGSLLYSGGSNESNETGGSTLTAIGDNQDTDQYLQVLLEEAKKKTNKEKSSSSSLPVLNLYRKVKNDNVNITDDDTNNKGTKISFKTFEEAIESLSLEFYNQKDNSIVKSDFVQYMSLPVNEAYKNVRKLLITRFDKSIPDEYIQSYINEENVSNAYLSGPIVYIRLFDNVYKLNSMRFTNSSTGENEILVP